VGYEWLTANDISNSYMINIVNGTTLNITGNGIGSVYSKILDSVRYCDLYYGDMLDHMLW